MIVCDPNFRHDLASSLSREWLETNGIGSYASSTITGANTRRYHGLLVAATRPPLGRMVLLSKLEETLIIDGHRFDLSTNRYPGTVHPQGYRLLKDVRLDPFPVFSYQAGSVEIAKRVFQVARENTTVIEYEFRGLDPSPARTCIFEVRPLIAFRDYHAMTHRNEALDPFIEREPGLVSTTPYAALPALYLAHDALEITAIGDWYYNFEYEIEFERGFREREDLFNPLALTFDVCSQPRATIVASTERHSTAEVPNMRQSEMERRTALIRGFRGRSNLISSLTDAADQFIVRRGTEHTIVAGYHWFTDWGRDTMIALPGLTLATGRPDVARSILLGFARLADQGMLPNRFPDVGETPEYNTVDASLWMFEAVRSYLAWTGDWEFVRKEIFAVLSGMVDWHVRGTRYGIHVDDDGLLVAGAPGAQLTWMDARVGDLVVTPRHGKPVEIQALWYNALLVMQHLAEQFDDPDAAATYSTRAARACVSFNQQFWSEKHGRERNRPAKTKKEVSRSMSRRRR